MFNHGVTNSKLYASFCKNVIVSIIILSEYIVENQQNLDLFSPNKVGYRKTGLRNSRIPKPASLYQFFLSSSKKLSRTFKSDDSYFLNCVTCNLGKMVEVNNKYNILASLCSFLTKKKDFQNDFIFIFGHRKFSLKIKISYF